MRRKAIHEGQSEPALYSLFCEALHSRVGADQPVTKAKQIVQRSGARWIRPPSGLVKINVDAAISKNTRTAASAVAVARDEMGHFLGASALVLQGIGCV
jgi:hypothetical protein